MPKSQMSHFWLLIKPGIHVGLKGSRVYVACRGKKHVLIPDFSGIRASLLSRYCCWATMGKSHKWRFRNNDENTLNHLPAGLGFVQLALHQAGGHLFAVLHHVLPDFQALAVVV